MRHIQQDHSSIHKAKAAEVFFLEYMVSLLEWPPYSPVVNPLEHM